jgi:hypothetical protein
LDLNSRKLGETDADYGLLAFDAENQLLLLDIDIEILSLQVSRYFDGNIKVTNCLGPFVWQSSLLFCFLGACCCLLFLSGL